MKDLSRGLQHCFQQHQKSSQLDWQSTQGLYLFQHTHAGIGVQPANKSTNSSYQKVHQYVYLNQRDAHHCSKVQVHDLKALLLRQNSTNIFLTLPDL